MKKRFTDEQIIAMIKEQVAGEKTADVCRRHGINSATFYKYKSKYGGMGAAALAVMGIRDVNFFPEAFSKREGSENLFLVLIEARRLPQKMLVNWFLMAGSWPFSAVNTNGSIAQVVYFAKSRERPKPDLHLFR